MQAKAAFGVKPVSSRARLGQRLISRADPSGKKGSEGEESTKSESKGKVEKAEKGGEKGSQVVEKVYVCSLQLSAAVARNICRASGRS